MENVLDECLFSKQPKQFEKIIESAQSFTSIYCGTTIVRDSIFSIVKNYARKRELNLELLRYPFDDDELWAFTFVKKGTIFLCVNSGLALCKQIFAVAHELYHVHCYADDKDPNTITKGSLLYSNIVDDIAVSQEDLEANAFAGLLLMPDNLLQEQIRIYGIIKEKISVDEVLVLMDLFALPYKAVVLRLVENKIISITKANDLLSCESEYITERIKLTGKALSWQSNTKTMNSFGSLLDNLEFNKEMELLTESREKADEEYLVKLQKDFSNEE